MTDEHKNQMPLFNGQNTADMTFIIQFLNLQKTWSSIQGNPVDPWQSSICGAFSGKQHLIFVILI